MQVRQPREIRQHLPSSQLLQPKQPRQGSQLLWHHYDCKAKAACTKAEGQQDVPPPSGVLQAAAAITGDHTLSLIAQRVAVKQEQPVAVQEAQPGAPPASPALHPAAAATAEDPSASSAAQLAINQEQPVAEQEAQPEAPLPSPALHQSTLLQSGWKRRDPEQQQATWHSSLVSTQQPEILWTLKASHRRIKEPLPMQWRPPAWSNC